MKAALAVLVIGHEIGAKETSYQAPLVDLTRGQHLRRDFDDEDDLVMRKLNSSIIYISLRVATAIAACLLNYFSVFVDVDHSHYHSRLLLHLGQNMIFVSSMTDYRSPVP